MILVGASISICSPRIWLSRSASVGILRQVDANVCQRLGERVFAAVADGRDSSAAYVLQDHALEQVVDVLDVELHFDLGVAVDLAGVLEKGHARAEHDDPLDGEVGEFVLGKDEVHARREQRPANEQRRHDNYGFSI